MKEFCENKKVWEIFEDWYHKQGVFEGRRTAGLDRNTQILDLFGANEKGDELSFETYQKVFKLIKFRSMDNRKDKNGELLPDEVRLNKYGRFLRASSLDELPELFNIIKGDMSIVGPRPERCEHVEKYCAAIPEFALRNKVKGGLTGFAQIYGKYNTSPYDKIKLDLMYIENYSFLLDIKLVLMTIRIVFKKESTEGFDKILSVDEILKMTETEED